MHCKLCLKILIRFYWRRPKVKGNIKGSTDGQMWCWIKDVVRWYLLQKADHFNLTTTFTTTDISDEHATTRTTNTKAINRKNRWTKFNNIKIFLLTCWKLEWSEETSKKPILCCLKAARVSKGKYLSNEDTWYFKGSPTTVHHATMHDYWYVCRC